MTETTENTIKWILQLTQKPPCGFSVFTPFTDKSDWCHKNCSTANVKQCWENAIINHWCDKISLTNKYSFENSKDTIWTIYFQTEN